jgi:hypothetical protein
MHDDPAALAGEQLRAACGPVQEGAGGFSAEQALLLAFDAAADRVDEVRYWSLAELAGGPDATFVAARCAELLR